MRLTTLAHQVLAAATPAGACAVDATAGNGHDTVFLAQTVGVNGQVLAIDRQADAIAATNKAIAAARIDASVTTVVADHRDLATLMDAHCTLAPTAIMFNLGYLPGSDKTLTTSADTTLPALDAALARLSADAGVLSVMTYRAHPGGLAEHAAVLAWRDSLPREYFRIYE
ncbi:MAG: class I SAM-dependent methyltransferase, partial [Pseudomonadota bacterium]